MYRDTQANADASAGTVNIHHNGTPIAGTPAPDISRGFSGIPRSAQHPLTASQQRILECTHRLAEANADIPYTLFVPSTYDPQKPAPLVVDLHGLNITPTATDPVRRHHGLRRAIRIHHPCPDGIQPVQLVGAGPERRSPPRP